MRILLYAYSCACVPYVLGLGSSRANGHNGRAAGGMICVRKRLCAVFLKLVVACGCIFVREAFCFMCQHRCLRICLGVFGFLLATSSYGSKEASGCRFFRRWVSPGHAAFAVMPGRALTLVRAAQLRGVPRPLSFVLPKQQREGSKTSPDIFRNYVFPEGPVLR